MAVYVAVGCGQFYTVSTWFNQIGLIRRGLGSRGGATIVLQHWGRDGFSMLESFPLPQGAGRGEGRVEWKCPTCHRPSEVAQNARDVASNSTDQKYPHQKHQKFVMRCQPVNQAIEKMPSSPSVGNVGVLVMLQEFLLACSVMTEGAGKPHL
jgi:hypothetical protein